MVGGRAARRCNAHELGDDMVMVGGSLIQQ